MDNQSEERGFVDILLLDEARRKAIILENKIGSTEGVGQLKKYYSALTNQGWQALGLYLTPYGHKASSSNYVSVSYTTVCTAINEMCADDVVSIADVRTLLGHYVDMVRRDIVNELDIDAACQRIYRKHKRALKIVQERVSVRRRIISDVMEHLVRQYFESLTSQSVGQVNIDKCIHKWKNAENDTPAIRFVSPQWKNVPLLQTDKWSLILESILELAVADDHQEVYINLQVGPLKDDIPRKLFDMARNRARLFTVKTAPKEYGEIYHRTLLSPEQYEGYSAEKLVQQIHGQWDGFVEQDLPLIQDAIQQWVSEASDN